MLRVVAKKTKRQLLCRMEHGYEVFSNFGIFHWFLIPGIQIWRLNDEASSKFLV